jgi:hypothetical protein
MKGDTPITKLHVPHSAGNISLVLGFTAAYWGSGASLALHKSYKLGGDCNPRWMEGLCRGLFRQPGYGVGTLAEASLEYTLSFPLASTAVTT